MSTIDLTTEPAPAPAAQRGRRRLRLGASTGHVYAYLTGLALVLAAGSLASIPTPSYDPWSWLVWGRQLLHGTLDTAGGPTWKPLPVVFTTIFALFGNLQPDLWLVVARWGFLLSVFIAFRIAARLVWSLRDEPDAAGAGLDRLVRAAPALLAGVVAASSLAFFGGFASDSALGYSEGLALAFTLIAFDRAVDGHHRQAFTAGLVVAWDRPESWIIWGPYGLWLMWKDAGARKLVISLAVLTLLAWFLPQKLGGGSFTSGVARAHNPRSNSAAHTSFPFWNEFRYHALATVYDRAKIVALLGAITALTVTFRARGGLRGWLHDRRHRAVIYIGGLGIVGLAWWVLISLETQAGFSGNDRYLVLGSGLVYVCCGASVGWATITLTRLVKRRLRRARPLARPAAAALAAALLVTLAYAFLPSGWVGDDMLSIRDLRYQLHYQAYLRVDMKTLIAKAGGYKAIRACGPVMVEDFQVPMAAWYLHDVFYDVSAQPAAVNAQGLAPVAPGQWPATIFQDRDSPNGPLLPTTTMIDGWQSQGARYTVTREAHMTMYQDCRG